MDHVKYCNYPGSRLFESMEFVVGTKKLPDGYNCRKCHKFYEQQPAHCTGTVPNYRDILDQYLDINVNNDSKEYIEISNLIKTCNDDALEDKAGEISMRYEKVNAGYYNPITDYEKDADFTRKCGCSQFIFSPAHTAQGQVIE